MATSPLLAIARMLARNINLESCFHWAVVQLRPSLWRANLARSETNDCHQVIIFNDGQTFPTLFEGEMFARREFARQTVETSSALSNLPSYHLRIEGPLVEVLSVSNPRERLLHSVSCRCSAREMKARVGSTAPIHPAVITPPLASAKPRVTARQQH